MGRHHTPYSIDNARRRAVRWLCALACLGAAASAGAAGKAWYDVELIVFERLDSDGLYSERWPQDPGSPALDRAVELTGSGQDPEMAGSPRAFQRLGRDELELSETWTRLRRSRGYRPLLHVGWRQPGFSRKEARAAHVRTSSRSGAADSGQLAAGGREPEKVDGTVRVYRARYLHVEADLLYHRPEARAALGGGFAAPTLFRLQTSRRLRSRELHYLDHPLYGVIVQITPYQAASPAAAVEESEPAPEGAGAGAAAAPEAGTAPAQ